MEETNKEFKKVSKTNYKLRVIVVLIFLVLAGIYMFIHLRGEYLNILAIGQNYIDVFNQTIRYQYNVMAINFLVLFFTIYFTTVFIKKGLKKFFEEDKIEMPKLPNKSISLILGAIFSIISTPFIVEKTMLAINSAQFGIADPIFSVDIGFFIFTKPFIEMILIYIVILFILLSIYIAIYYIIAFNRFFDGINIETLKKNTAIKQIVFNVMIIVIAIAGLVFMNSYNVLFDKSIQTASNVYIYGGGLTDVTIKVWGYRVLAIIMPIIVFMGIRYVLKSQKRKAVITLLTMPALLVALFIIMTGFQLIVVNPNELDREKEYIAKNIEYTKQAYNINIEEIELTSNGNLNSEQLESNKVLFNNIPIITKNVVLESLEEYQTSTGYYAFKNASLAKYKIDNEETLCYVAPREIVSDNGRTYNTRTYEYTHGYGAIIASASKVDEDNNIVYIQKGLGDDNKISVIEPRIYFGLQTNQTIITNVNNNKEYDYPITSSTNAENVYDGKAGISLSWLDRLILGIHIGDISIALNSNINENSKVVTNRNIIKRAKALMPYLIYDENPYMIITDDGRQVWVLDAYTTSSSYPYSQEALIEVEKVKSKINYIRNSVKVFVDAYDGTIKFYITDSTDPIVMAYRNIYPKLFMDKDEKIPEGMEKHLVYPQFLYNVQAEMLNLYHNVQTEVLYRNDDMWSIAKTTANKVSTTGTGTVMNSYYTMLKPVNSEQEEFGLVIPYTKYNKQNIIAYLVGTYNGDNVLKLYKFNSDSNVLGAMQLENQIEQDANLSAELKALNVMGTKLVKSMIIIPIDNTLLYVEPVYQVLLNESQVPKLSKIIVASGNKIAIGNDIDEAIERLISQEASKIEIEDTDEEEGLIKAIIKANKNLEESNSNNDWELIGKDITRLQALINQLEELLEKENKQTSIIENPSLLPNQETNVVNNVIGNE